jgi:eukaryotic-like serine/threonine-protein kinase
VFKFLTHRPLWINILSGLAIAAIIFFCFIFSLNWCTHHNRSRTVPAVLGKSFSEAVEILDKAGFEVQIQDSIYTDTSEPLMVLKQVPEADELVKVNRTVYLTINRAVPPMIEMPNLVGYSYRSAEMALKNANLQAGETIFKPDFAKNAVLEQLYEGQKITPGTKIRMGSKISLVLGDGIGDEQFPVPSLIGLTFCEAKILLREHGVEFGSIIAPGVEDSCNAYISKQMPERFNEEKKFRYIRPGQQMDIWLTIDKPVIDSLALPGVPPADDQ